MLTTQVADLLRTARKALGLSQKELARRAGVSHRLWAEVERRERPHVSLETALRLLAEVGVTVRLTDPLGTSHELNSSSTAARAARAAVRRTTWQGRQIRLSQEGQEVDDAPTSTPGADRLAGVALVSEQAFAVAGGPRIPAHDFGAPPHLIDPAFLLSRNAVTQIGLPPLRIDLLASITSVSFGEVRAGAEQVELEGQQVFVIGLTELRANKSATDRAKDRTDLRRLDALPSTAASRPVRQRKGNATASDTTAPDATAHHRHAD